MRPAFKKNIFPILLIWFFLLIDLFSKHFIYNLGYLSNFSIIYPSFNYWISWSIPVNSLVSILVAIFALFLFIYAYSKKYIGLRAFVLLVSGAIWNVLDRIFLWWVRDFLMPFSWFPIFNFADIFLTLWLILYLYSEIFTWKSKSKI